MKRIPSSYAYFAFLLISIFLSACSNQNKKMGGNPDALMPDLQVSSGTIDPLPDFPSKIVASRHVAVWLPETYNKNTPHAVLYMHDGQMLFDSTSTWNKQEWGVDEVASELMVKNKVMPFIVVDIWNSGKSRHSDYFPQKPFENLSANYQDSLLSQAQRNEQAALFSMSIQSDNYLRFLVEELKPYIDSTYTTKPGRAHTFIGGSSMGGLISMYAVCEYPQVFGGAACISTHWMGTFSTEKNPIPDAFVDYLVKHLPPPTSNRFYFDYGTATLDALYEPYQLRVDSVMKAKGFDQKNWQTLKFEGADHSEKSWHDRLHHPLVFLLGKQG